MVILGEWFNITSGIVYVKINKQYKTNEGNESNIIAIYEKNLRKIFIKFCNFLKSMAFSYVILEI